MILTDQNDYKDLITWIDRHAPLAALCERSGWPDGSTLRMKACSRESQEWIVDISFIEVIQEMSECDPTRIERCGRFVIRFDTSGEPESIRLLHTM